MLLYFITCISFFLFLKSLLLRPLPSWATEMRLLLLLFSQELSVRTISKLFRNRFWLGFVCQIPAGMSLVRKSLTSRVENVEESHGMSVLDLPELALDCILERLPPSSLCQMVAVCRYLRERCVSDHLWERHMKQKWGSVIGPAAYREWKWHVASKNNVRGLKHGRQRGLMRFLSLRWPLQWMRPKVDENNSLKQRTSLPVDSIMNWYLAIESGNFCFPAQVYNRENGHVGFMLSCYDATISYDPRTDTFQARYPPHGRRADAKECGIPWERLRAPPIDASPHDLHVSDCLNDLNPGDHIEIQWRRNKEFPYGWWYGVVGHLESCNGSENYCRCHKSVSLIWQPDQRFGKVFLDSNLIYRNMDHLLCYLVGPQDIHDTVVLEFNHYTPGSRWRQTTVSRKDHREEGNEADGFYGGIRKIKSEAEIAIWKRLWPSEVLDS